MITADTFDQNMQGLVEIMESLRGANLQARSEVHVRERLRELLKLAKYEGLGISRDENQIWYRARKCETPDGYSNLDQVLYPPPNSVDLGRANLRGASVLYASWNPTVAIEEIGAEAGDVVQLVALRVAPGFQLPCHIVGEYESVLNSGGSLVNSRKLEQAINEMHAANPLRVKEMQFVDSFFAEAFRKRVERPYEYRVTALYAERILAAPDGGLMYPSVRLAGGINLAVTPTVCDERFEILFSDVWKIERYYGYGMYFCSPIKHATTFEPDGIIAWNTTKDVPWTRDLQSGLRFSIPFFGWRRRPPTDNPEGKQSKGGSVAPSQGAGNNSEETRGT